MDLAQLNSAIKEKGFSLEITSTDEGWYHQGNEWARIWNVGDSGIRIHLGRWNSSDRATVVSGLEGYSKKDLATLNKEAKLREKELSDKNLRAAEICSRIWGAEIFSDIKGDPGDYGLKKGLPRDPNVLCLPAKDSNAKYLMVPMVDETGKLWNIQNIGSAGGGKFYKAEGRTKGLFYKFEGHMDRILLCEGYGTGLALWSATGFTVYVAFTVTNLEIVLKIILNSYKPWQVVLCADWDAATFTKTGVNPGMKAAVELSKQYKVQIAEPISPGVDSHQNIDFADLLPDRMQIQRCISSSQDASVYADFEFDTTPPKKKKEKKLMAEPIPNANTEPVIPNVDEVLELAKDWHHKVIVSPEEALQNRVTSEAVVPEVLDPVVPGFIAPPEELPKFNADDFPTADNYFRISVGRNKTIPDLDGLGHYLIARDGLMDTDGGMYTYANRHYSRMSRKEFPAYVNKHLEPNLLPGHVKQYTDKVMMLANRKAPDPREIQGFINLKNGVLKVKTGELLPSSPKYFFKYVLPHEYNPHATCPNWEKFLDTVFQGDQELVKIAGEMFGYCLLGGDPFLHKIFLLLGDGRNGKGTFSKTLDYFLGEENISSVPPEKLGDSFSVVICDGKLANIVNETTKKEIESSYLKLAAGGEKIMAAWKGVDNYAMTFQARIILSANSLPFLKDTTAGTYEKFCTLPFNKYFPEDERRVHFFEEDLKPEMSGIVNWALEGLKRLMKQGGLTSSKAVREERLKMRLETDHVFAWFLEAVEFSDDLPEMEAKLVDYYIDFEDWNLKQGHLKMAKQSFGRRLAAEFKKYNAEHTHRHSLVFGERQRYITVRGRFRINKIH